MNDGSSEWVLEAVVDKTDPQVSAVLTKMNQLRQNPARQRPAQAQSATVAAGVATPFSQYGLTGLELVKWAAAMMLADGQIDPKELEMLNGIARQRDVSGQKLQNIITELKSAEDPVDFVMRTSTLATSNELLVQLARVALSDGRLSDEENAMLQRVGQRIGMQPADVNMLVSRERRNLYQEAKMAISQAKHNK